MYGFYYCYNNIASLPEAVERVARLKAQLKELKDMIDEKGEKTWPKLWPGLMNVSEFGVVHFHYYHCTFQ